MSVTILTQQEFPYFFDIKNPSQNLLLKLRDKGAPIQGRMWLKLNPDYFYTGSRGEDGSITVTWLRVDDIQETG